MIPGSTLPHEVCRYNIWQSSQLLIIAGIASLRGPRKGPAKGQGSPCRQRQRVSGETSLGLRQGQSLGGRQQLPPMVSAALRFAKPITRLDARERSRVGVWLVTLAQALAVLRQGNK